MKIDFDVKFKTFDGQDIAMRDKPATLKDISVESLMGLLEEEKNLSGEEKLKRYELALKIKDGGIIDISVEDIALIKKLTGKMFAPLIVGQAWKNLEGGSNV